MHVHNFLPQFLAALKRWPDRPSEKEFATYLQPVEKLIQPMIDDFIDRFGGGLYQVTEGLNWEVYRAEALRLDSMNEEKRARAHIENVEKCLGLHLEGDVVLFGAFTAMDGYARFDHGKHTVYLGVDESHGRGAYLDILISHELTHVAREPLPEIWAGFGLTPDMSHDEFTQNLPVIEHLMGEGFSCVVSELINPHEPYWNYVYQTEDSLAQILAHGPAIDKVVHAELRKKDKGSYGSLYDTSRYVPEVPRYAHYVWAWLWASHVLKTKAGGNPRTLLRLCSKDLLDDALAFKLPKAL
ncbi:MAG: hypothetical protein HY074_19300 [Deltaproteobacteria bacterium]|nr:hypothetical protein [Deltaproteobacteria bacterium]